MDVYRCVRRSLRFGWFCGDIFSSFTDDGGEGGIRSIQRHPMKEKFEVIKGACPFHLDEDIPVMRFPNTKTEPRFSTVPKTTKKSIKKYTKK